MDPETLPEDIPFRDDLLVGFSKPLSLNLPVQGSAAEVMQLALINTHRALNGSSAKLIATVHDELVLECPTSLVDETEDLVVDAMTAAFTRLFPEAPVERLVNAASGPSWGELSSRLDRKGGVILNVAQRRDALDLLRALPAECAPLAFFDPQHRGVLDHLQFGNEGSRQRGRAHLPAMPEQYIDACCLEIARTLAPSGYLMLWVDTFGLCESHHLRIVEALKPVDLIAWDSLRMGMGKRSRRRGDYLLVLQKPPIGARTWRDHAIPSRWPEKVDRAEHPHIKPIGLISRLIAAVTEPGDLVIDPAAGSFVVMQAAKQLDRNFVGCDCEWRAAKEGNPLLALRRTS